MCENAIINNGKFELSILPEVTYENIPGVLDRLLDFGFNAEAVKAHIIRARAHEFTVSSDSELQINLDGEPLQSHRFHFRVLDKAVRLHLPADTDIVMRD